MKNPIEVLKTIEAEAAQNATDVRWVRTCSVGDEIRQGDVYLYPVEEPAKPGAKVDRRQLAPGSTPGSRHIVEARCRQARRL